MSLNLDTDEKVVFEVRKHWFVLFTKGLFALFIILVPLVLYAVLISLKIEINMPGNVTAFLCFIYGIIIMLTWILLFYWWTDYYLDVWVITNKKLIAIEQVGLFGRQISTLHFSKVQDVSSDIMGIVATFMKFGNVEVQTAAEEDNFVIKQVAGPDNVRTKINEVLSAYHEEHGF